LTVQVLNIDGKATNNPQAIASAFNKYFLSLVEKIYLNNNNNKFGDIKGETESVIMAAQDQAISTNYFKKKF
jgi:hypothetical protein